MKKIVLSMLCASANIFYAATLRVYNKTTMPVKVTITYSDTSKTDTIKPNNSSTFNSWFYDLKTVTWDEWSVELDMPAGNIGGEFTIYNNGIFESTRKEELQKVYKNNGYLQAVGYSGLMSAVRQGNLAKVKELLAKGAVINPMPITPPVSPDDFPVPYYPETNALNEAVKNKDKAMINFLLAHGADPNAKIGNPNIVGGRYVHIMETAVFTGDIEIVKLLVENGAKPADFHLEIAIGKNYFEIVKLLVENGVKPHAFHLKTAIGKNYFDIVKLLIENGAGIRGDSLQLAIDKNYFDIAKYLIAKGGAATNVALNHAAYWGNKPFAEYLINAGANVSEKDKIGETPLIVASKRGARDVVQLLLNKGAHVNSLDNNSDTALMIAAMNGFEDIVKMLIDAGADVTIKNKNGATARSFAVVKGNANIIKMIEEAKAEQKGGTS